MADFHVYRDRLEIRLTRAEKVLALRRDDIVVPRDSIRSVAITEDPWIWIRGVRAPGNSIPLTLAVGTWKFHGGKDFLVLKGKQRSAVVIDIDQPDAGGSDKPVPQTATILTKISRTSWPAPRVSLVARSLICRLSSVVCDKCRL